MRANHSKISPQKNDIQKKMTSFLKNSGQQGFSNSPQNSQTLPQTEVEGMFPHSFIKASVTPTGKPGNVPHAMKIINQCAQKCNYSVKS